MINILLKNNLLLLFLVLYTLTTYSANHKDLIGEVIIIDSIVLEEIITINYVEKSSIPFLNESNKLFQLIDNWRLGSINTIINKIINVKTNKQSSTQKSQWLFDCSYIRRGNLFTIGLTLYNLPPKYNIKNFQVYGKFSFNYTKTIIGINIRF